MYGSDSCVVYQSIAYGTSRYSRSRQTRIFIPACCQSGSWSFWSIDVSRSLSGKSRQNNRALTKKSGSENLSSRNCGCGHGYGCRL